MDTYSTGHTNPDSSSDELTKISVDLAENSATDLSNFDKNYFVVATGVLAFSVAFIKEIVSLENVPSLVLLYIAWALMAMAIALILLSFLWLSLINYDLNAGIKDYLEEAFRKKRRRRNEHKDVKRIVEESTQDNFWLRMIFRGLSIVSFIAGLVVLLLFIMISLHREKKAKKKTEGASIHTNKDSLKISVSPDTVFLKVIQTTDPPNTGKPKDPNDPEEIVIIDPPPPPPTAHTSSCPPYVLQNVYFDFDRASLRPESYRELDSLANILRADPAKQVIISAHTDNRGSDRYNKMLSQQRANSVAKYLERKSILAKRIISNGFGETMPLGSNDTEFGRQRNRRVEFLY